MRQNNRLDVYYKEQHVGTLALANQKRLRFNIVKIGWRPDFQSATFLCHYEMKFLFLQRLF